MGIETCINEIVDLVDVSSNLDVTVLGNVPNKFFGNLSDIGCRVSIIEDTNKIDSTKQTDFSLVISCDLFTNKEDSFVRKTLENVLKCLKIGGTYAFCETCAVGPNDGIVKQHLRKPSFYSSYIESVTLKSEVNGVHDLFEIMLSKVLKSSNTRVLWLVNKVRSQKNDTFGYSTFQEFLNCKQYSTSGILKYEKIFGQGFISTGGIDTTREFVDYLRLKKDEHVLDVGSGIGGGDFYMSENFGVKVTGVDLSSNVVAIALDRWNAKKHPDVSFEVCDATKRKFSESTFNVIYSRDTILHIADKRHLFSSFLKWLKPGGRVLISDYCCCEGDWSKEYAQYVKQRGYFLLSVKDYGRLLEEVGFVNVRAEARTDQFVEMLKKELDRIASNREDFLKDFTENDLDALLNGWRDKLKRCAEGYQTWGLFYAEKA